jgi:hypothetical protein
VRFMVNKLVTTTLKRIGIDYQPGALEWLKQNRPKDWEKMIVLENEINRLASDNDEKGLAEALDKYERFVLKVIALYSNYPVFEMWVEDGDGKKTVLFSDRILPAPACFHAGNTGTDDSKMWQEKIERKTAKKKGEAEQESFTWLHSRDDRDEETS